MATTITKLFPTGILQSSVEFDEVTSIGGSAIGGSILFPTSSYLASGTALTLGVTCTVECWFRTTSNPATSKIVLVAGNGNRGISIYNGVYGQTGYSATKFTVDWETAGNIEFTVPTMSANIWYHLAVTQTALGVMTLWLNGARSSTGTLTPNWSFISNAYRVGAWSSQSIYSQGVYISNVRITTTAVYDVTQTSITVPTSPLTAIAGTQLLLNMSTSGSAYTDSSTNAITMTATGTPSWSGTVTPFTGISTAIRVSPTGVYAAQFDEFTQSAIKNLAIYSEDLTNSAWSKVSLTTFGNTATTADPKGTYNANLIIETNTTTRHAVTDQRPISSTSTITYTFSTYLKQYGGIESVSVWMTSVSYTSGNRLGAQFNLDTGTLLFQGETGLSTVIRSSIEPAGNGWYRCSVSGSLNDTTTTVTYAIGLNSDVANRATVSNSYLGDGVSGIYVWGSQLEANSVMTPYQGIGADNVIITPDFAERRTSTGTYIVSGYFDEYTYSVAPF